MESSTFKALVEKTKARSDKDLIETIWYRTVRKVADFKDDAEDSKRFVTRIEEHVNKIFFYNKATTVKNEDELTFMDKKELLDLWILYVVESDTFDFGKYETERVLKGPMFFRILAEYFETGIVFTWNKLVATYNFFKRETDSKETAIIRAYSNVWQYLSHYIKIL